MRCTHGEEASKHRVSLGPKTFICPYDPITFYTSSDQVPL